MESMSLLIFLLHDAERECCRTEVTNKLPPKDNMSRSQVYLTSCTTCSAACILSNFVKSMLVHIENLCLHNDEYHQYE